jgi:hypothetical protein
VFADKRNKNIYGLWMGISTVFKILKHFRFKGDETIQYGHDQHTIKCSLTQRTNIYIWFKGGDLNGFQDIKASLV